MDGVNCVVSLSKTHYLLFSTGSTLEGLGSNIAKKLLLGHKESNKTKGLKANLLVLVFATGLNLVWLMLFLVWLMLEHPKYISSDF